MTQVPQTRRTEGAGPEHAGETVQTGSLLADLRSGSGGGGEGQPETPFVNKPRRSFPTQHLVTVVVFVAGAGALVAMRQYGMGAGMTFDKGAKIEFVETVSHRRTPEQERILNDLERGVTATLPDAAEIRKNPFILVAGPPPTAAVVVDNGPNEAERTADERRRRAKDVEAALGSVVLNGIMNGGVPLARVNGEIVRVGDKVADTFTVAAIQGRSILLTADGQVYIVEMSQESDPRPQPQVRERTTGR